MSKGALMAGVVLGAGVDHRRVGPGRWRGACTVPPLGIAEPRAARPGSSASDADRERLVFFTELNGLEGHTVTHRWVHENNQVQAKVSFDVGGPRWRVWSSKDLVPGWTGTWTVEVWDDQGNFYGTWSAEYGGTME
ncbi:MAG: DUF2914 domain-containing protein [Halofilum sp. (in: g-proteobacteria)]|nr:DUF2914 domain-containing protein [Halofilum sp. (in: g-proteobacteria)]